ncbi:hypothetical protein GCM10009860_25260 [Microbacterium mitrae]|uniref:Secreted protein n=1 Tax=Microbacterium mitrae TaxID=664640 RepID=A0A5C8HJW5_9MICO|nr:hypothetical protein [Microbacterium mitrae]TXK02720.1 hypothetical protein FVP60_12635 [Microbacterium mitrae]
MNRRLAALILAVPLTIAALTGCSNSAGGGGDNGGTESWPANVTENFISSCEASSGGQTAYCECSLEALQSEYTLEEFTELEKNVNDPATQEALGEVISACQSEVK